MREDFEKAVAHLPISFTRGNGYAGYFQISTGVAWLVWQIRQPEIDALKEAGAGLLDVIAAFRSENDRARKAYLEYEQENFLLKAENERLQEVAKAFKDTRDLVIKEKLTLEAENERLKADAETLYKAAAGLQNAFNELWKAENPDETTGPIMDLDDAVHLHGGAWIELNSAIHYMRKNAAMEDFSTHQKE